jgi:hypothetical protein
MTVPVVNVFTAWRHDTLADFAQEAAKTLRAQELELQRLREDLRTAIDAYRVLLKEKNPLPVGMTLAPLACTQKMADAAWGGEHANWREFAAQYARALAAAN